MAAVDDDHSVFTHDHYRYILECARSAGYRFIDFRELDRYRGTDERACVLRHDCDNDLVAAATMARIENEAGVVSTYCLMLSSCMYNVLSPPNATLVRDLVRYGHRLGLHFDRLAYPGVAAAEIPAHVERERELLETRFDAEVDVVSFHQPSAEILDGRVKTELLNAYDAEDMAGYHYVSDSNTVWREGCACAWFSRGEATRLQLLIHPEWWTRVDMPLEEKWRAMFADNFELCQESMLERERAYHRRQRIRFDAGSRS